MTAPVVSVVIPAYNAAAVLPLQLSALMTQADAPPFEVIVVDNGSTDATADVVLSLAPEVSFPLRVERATQRQGPGYARNVGAGLAAASRLMFADADDVVSRWWLAAGVRAFEEATLWTGGAHLLTDEQFEGTLDQIRAAMGDADDRLPLAPGDLEDPFPVLMGGDFGATTEVFKRLGGFDVSLGTAFEDNDLGMRAHLAGIPVGAAPSARIAFRGKWDVGFRARLARRQAMRHVVAAGRYGLLALSPMPHPVREIVNPVAGAVAMTLGRRPRDFASAYLRMATGVGLVEGHVRHRLRAFPEPEIGVGYAPRTARAESPREMRAP